MIKKATQRRIDTVWTLEYLENDNGTISVIRYSREDPEGYEKEKELQRCSVVEGERRKALSVMFTDYKNFTYHATNENKTSHKTIANQKNIFAYKGWAMHENLTQKICWAFIHVFACTGMLISKLIGVFSDEKN